MKAENEGIQSNHSGDKNTLLGDGQGQSGIGSKRSVMEIFCYVTFRQREGLSIVTSAVRFTNGETQ
jgi:hypothetical protein